MACAKAECPLFYYARGVALEFAVLFVLLTYVGSYALHDCNRLLARPEGARLVEAPDAHAESECTPRSRPLIAPPASGTREAEAGRSTPD